MSSLLLALFVGFSSPFCGQINIQQQAALYGKTPVQITYFVSPPRPITPSISPTTPTILTNPIHPPKPELRRLSRPRNRRLHLVAALPQIRPLLRHILDTLWPARHADLGAVDDEAESIRAVSPVSLLFRFFWRNGFPVGSEIYRGFVFLTSTREGVYCT